MIQRVQTIFLFLIAVGMGVTLSTQLWHQGDGLHHGAVTLASPIAEVNGEGFKFHRVVVFCNKLEKSRTGGKSFLKKKPCLMTGLLSFIEFDPLTLPVPRPFG